MGVAHIELKELSIVYRTSTGSEVLAVDRVDLSVEKGEFVCLLGPSGCGKSTMLTAIDGLIPATGGTIAVNGQAIRGPGPDRAVVFQEFALMPWLNVIDNIVFGLKLRGTPRSEQLERARHYIQLVGLKGFERSYPHQLSGGMRQRVGIARALAVNPDMLLMDEPFGALDAQTREIMSVELLKLWDQERKTVVFVTHSLDEAVYLADRVVVMTAGPGRIKQIIPIELPRPRGHEIRDGAVFNEYRRLLWALLEEEVQAAMAGGGRRG